jgi:hypothetical protein
VTGYAFAFGECWLCGRHFSFDPDLVPSVFVDPATGRPPDVTEQGEAIVPEREAVERAMRVPLCADCVELANERRRAVGSEPIAVLPGAYGRE